MHRNNTECHFLGKSGRPDGTTKVSLNMQVNTYITEVSLAVVSSMKEQKWRASVEFFVFEILIVKHLMISQVTRAMLEPQ